MVLSVNVSQEFAGQITDLSFTAFWVRNDNDSLATKCYPNHTHGRAWSMSSMIDLSFWYCRQFREMPFFPGLDDRFMQLLQSL